MASASPFRESRSTPTASDSGLPGACRWLLAGAALVLAGAGLHFANPSTDAGSALCPSRRLLHLPCPGCGLTRAFLLLAKGEWRDAFRLHPLSPLLAAQIALAWLGWGSWLAVPRLRRALPEGVPPLEPLLWANAALLVTVWIFRAAAGTLPW